MSRPLSRTKKFWHWLEGDGALDRASVIRMPPPAPARGGEQFRPASPPPPGRGADAQAVAAPAPAALGKFDQRAALVSAFNPSHPIRHVRDLRGRKDALESLSEAMLWQRQHAIVHGPRGSGKTSLVRIFADRADRQGVVLIYVSCESKSSFGDLVRPLLQTIPASNIPIGGEKAFRAEAAALGRDFAPQAAVSLLNTLEAKPIVFILDEFDRITHPAVRDEVATCMKLLSDTLSPVQILVVGIAQSVDELISSHPSLRRHVTAVGIGAIPDAEIDRLLADGGQRVELPFTPEARALIVEATCGSPYHARLFGYHAGAKALMRQGDRVTRADALGGLRLAFDRWAQLNREDSGLFKRLATKSAESRRMLAAEACAIARDADPHAEADPAQASIDTQRALSLLTPALLATTADGRPAFRDNTAPQFLLAALLLAGETGERAADLG